MGNTSRRNFIRIAALVGVNIKLAISSALAANSLKEDKEMKEEALVFLFQGDSITNGNRGRNNDPNHIMGHGYAFAVASRVGADFPASGFTFYNRGISGNTIPDLQKRWQPDTLDLNPDVLSILVGINDVGALVDQRPGNNSLEEFERAYRKLLEQSRKLNPNLLIVLGLPFVYAVGKRKTNWETWQNGTYERAKLVKKLARDFDAVLVDYPAVFDRAINTAPAEYWVWDGIHPTVFGHELMAREWIKQVGTRLKFLNKQYKY